MSNTPDYVAAVSIQLLSPAYAPIFLSATNFFTPQLMIFHEYDRPIFTPTQSKTQHYSTVSTHLLSSDTGLFRSGSVCIILRACMNVSVQMKTLELFP